MAVDFSLFEGADSLTEGKQRRSSESRRRFSLGNDPHAVDGYPGPPQDPCDFLWLMTEEPHRTSETHGNNAGPSSSHQTHGPRISYKIHRPRCRLAIALYLTKSHVSPLSFTFVLLAYVVGGTANHNLFLAIHEITHNLAFKSVVMNRVFGCVCKLADCAAAFKNNHIEHHKFLGQDGIDTDLPTRIELILLNNVLGKVFFVMFQIFFYALRPMFVRVHTLTRWHLLNVVTQL